MHHKLEGRVQNTVSLSTIEVKHMAIVEASKEVLWFRGLVETFSIIQDSVRVYCDNQSAIHLAKDHRYHKKMKQIDVRYHKIRQCVMDDKVIDLVNISKKKNSTDMMTKIIPAEKFRASLNFIKVLQR